MTTATEGRLNPAELEERMRKLRTRFDEFRGRL